MSEQDYQIFLIAGCVVGYVVYLLFLVLISFNYFTRSQILVLLAATGAFSALLIQAVAHSTGWVVLSSILALPVMPFVVGGLMLRHNQNAEPEAPGAGESETLTTLVRNRRLRGLTPQESPPSDVPTAKQLRAAIRRRAIVIALIVGVVLGAGTMTYRRFAYLRKADFHAQEESRCREHAMLLDQIIDDLGNQGPPSERDLRAIERHRRSAAEWIRRADWHAQMSEHFAGRW